MLVFHIWVTGHDGHFSTHIDKELSKVEKLGLDELLSESWVVPEIVFLPLLWKYSVTSMVWTAEGVQNVVRSERYQD